MIKTSLLATLIAIGTLFGAAVSTATPAKADGRFSFGVEFGNGYHHDVRRGDRRWRGWDRPRRGVCRPGRALRKARRMGVRRAYVHRVGRRGVVVGGRRYGERVRVGFARAPGCPVRFARRVGGRYY